MRFVVLATLLFSATSAFAQQTRMVNCDTGQSLNHTLATLDNVVPATVKVQGTCTEYVLVNGFNDLTLTGAPGATIQQPNTNPPSIPTYVLSIKGSRNVTVAGLAQTLTGKVGSSTHLLWLAQKPEPCVACKWLIRRAEKTSIPLPTNK